MKFTTGPDIYTIHSLQTTPHKDLAKVVAKHQQTQFQRPISNLQRDIFMQVDEDIKQQPVLLDIGCGTGQSSEKLAEQYPNYWVVGIDKSQSRLNKHAVYQQGGERDNLLLVRADAIAFWRLAIEANWQVVQQTIFYPNPYPKPNDLTKRWHGHPVFPFLLQLGKTIEVRSNWRIYLEEFRWAAKQLGNFVGQVTMMTPYQTPISAFEKKYWDNDVKTYQLTLRRI